MQNPENWKPTKFVVKSGQLVASRDRKKVAVSSRMMVDLIGVSYSKAIPEYCSGRLLDLGCGHVPMFEFYQSYIEENVCIDWAESLHQNEFLDCVHDLTQPLPLSDEAFDTIICSDVMEHIPNPGQLWNEISRLLKPGGHLIFNVPFLYGVHEAPHDFHRYTLFALKKYCETNRLEIVQLKPVGGAVEVIADIAAKVMTRIPLLGGSMAIVTQWLAKLLRKTGVEVLPHQFPLLYFLVARKSVHA